MLRSAVLTVLLAAGSVAAVKCSLSQKCPEDAPCCSQYGDCGVGAFCLGGCDPRMSFSLDACAPAPVCESRSLKFNNVAKSVVDISKYLGDESKADWVSQGEAAQYGQDALLTMPKNSPGTVLASTTYLWYGNVKARMKTSRGRGVVTAFILLSDVKDEIDYEWVGVDLETSQTNYYFQGIPDYNNSGNISTSDTFNEYHTYEIRWTPDKIEWLVDDKVGRTKERKDTWNSTTQSWDFPQTPARVQLSIWPGGNPTGAPGTIEWAGGIIDWDHPDVKTHGYFYATVSDVEIECYQTKSAPGTNSGKSYTYDDAKGTNDTVVDGDKSTIMGSIIATGLDMDKGKSKDSKSGKSQATIPGGGSTGQDHSDGTDKAQSGGNSGGGNVGGTAPSGDGADPATCKPTDFNQKCGSGSSSSTGNGQSGSGKTFASSSAFAIVVAAASACFWL